jgi:hypothetical protein
VRLPVWQLDRDSASPPPLSPVDSSSEAELRQIRLIPYGATTLRIAEFPAVVGSRIAERTGDLAISASYAFEMDSLAAIHDGCTDDSPRHTFWPHRGVSAWAQYGFDQPKSISRVAIWWHDDTGRGECRTPESCRLLYRMGDVWLPVQTSASLASSPDDADQVMFAPLTTTALRLEIDLRDEYSAGIREWEFN